MISDEKSLVLMSDSLSGRVNVDQLFEESVNVKFQISVSEKTFFVDLVEIERSDSFFKIVFDTTIDIYLDFLINKPGTFKILNKGSDAFALSYTKNIVKMFPISKPHDVRCELIVPYENI